MGSGPRAKGTCLKPPEYRGDKNTAVAGKIEILNQQELPAKQTGQGLGQPKEKGKGASTTQPQTVRKVEAHLAATTGPTEVLYIEAWGEIGDKLMQLCQVGDVVTHTLTQQHLNCKNVMSAGPTPCT